MLQNAAVIHIWSEEGQEDTFRYGPAQKTLTFCFNYDRSYTAADFIGEEILIKKIIVAYLFKYGRNSFADLTLRIFLDHILRAKSDL